MVLYLLVVVIGIAFGVLHGWLTAGPLRQYFSLFGADGVIGVILAAFWNGLLNIAVLFGPSVVLFKVLGLIPLPGHGLGLLGWAFALLSGSALGKLLHKRHERGRARRLDWIK